jgi:hypothetical protein
MIPIILYCNRLVQDESSMEHIYKIYINVFVYVYISIFL